MLHTLLSITIAIAVSSDSEAKELSRCVFQVMHIFMLQFTDRSSYVQIHRTCLVKKPQDLEQKLTAIVPVINNHANYSATPAFISASKYFYLLTVS
jgi:hypothetical protein